MPLSRRGEPLGLKVTSLDPQQQRSLEISWKALEDAGIDPDRLMGSRSGVYLGIGSREYQEIVRDERVGAGSDTPLYLGTGSRFNTAECMYAECDYY